MPAKVTTTVIKRGARWIVSVDVGGHAYAEIEADTEAEAKRMERDLACSLLEQLERIS